MKSKNYFLLLGLTLISILSFTPKKEYILPQKAGEKFCSTTFSAQVVRGNISPFNLPTINLVDVIGLVSYSTSTTYATGKQYLGAEAFSQGNYAIDVSISGPFKFVYILDAGGVPVNGTNLAYDVNNDSGYPYYHFDISDIYLYGCGEDYTIVVRAN